MGGANKKKIYSVTENELEMIAEVAAKEAIKAFKTEQVKEDRRRKRNDDKVKRTKKMLESYRRVKATLSEETVFTKEEEIELRWKFIEDLMGNSSEMFAGKAEISAIDTERKRQENLYCIYRIENAVKLYEDECDKLSCEEGKRRYRELYDLYISDTPLTIQEIAEKENISEKTVYKDIGISCKIVAAYLLGM